MRYLLFLSMLFSTGLVSYASPGDTIRVRAHNATHLNWYGNFDRRAEFPTSETSFQKILLRYTLGCPSTGCSEWDYTTRVFVLRPTGLSDTTGNPIKEEIELCRLITPYAGNFANSWKWTYTFDITDYEPMLHDSTDIRVQFQGYQDGFTATLDFEFVEGTPPHVVSEVFKIYEGSSSYGDPNNSIENFLSEKNVTIPAGTQYAKMVYRPSGHGFGGNENCAEFCPKYFYVKTDNITRGQALIWNETCGLNPLFPQPGTWLYDRANWCPGGPTGDFAFNLTSFLTAGNHTVNVDMEPFTNINNNSCSYNVSGHLFTFGAPSFNNDAELVEILTPNNNKNYGRFNPVCHEAKVIIRNTGSNALTSVKLMYGVTGGSENEVVWTGNLSFLQSDTFSFPVADWSNAVSVKNFSVRIAEANGQADDYVHNNAQSSHFIATPSYPYTFVLDYKTNNKPSDNAWTIKDAAGNVVYSRFIHTASTVYQDTLTFVDGCYVFEFTDASKNGLSFFNFNSDGSGYVRFKRAENTSTLKSFNSNFGTSVVQRFTVGGLLSVDEPLAEQAGLTIFPNPANSSISIQVSGMQQGEAFMQVLDMNGRQIFVEKVMLNGEALTRDISSLAAGMYVIRMVNAKGSARQKFVKE